MRPDADKLSALPLRALVAYALRSGYRLAKGLDQLHPEASSADVLDCAHRFVTVPDIDERDFIRALSAGERMSAFSAAHSGSQAGVLASALVEVALATYSAIRATQKSSDAHLNKMRTAARAERVASRAEWLDDAEASLAIEASCREYQALLDKFGETDDVVIGEPVDMSEVFGD